MSYNVEYQIAKELASDLKPDLSLEEEYEFPVELQKLMIRAIKRAALAAEENENNYDDRLAKTMFGIYKNVLLRLMRAFNFMELGLFVKAFNQIQTDSHTMTFLKAVSRDAFEFLYQKASETED